MKARNMNSIFTLVALCLTGAVADYHCICNYAVETSVLSRPDTSSQAIGYLYEFDCKHKLDVPGLQSNLAAIEFEHKLAYVTLNDQTEEQSCQGTPPESDRIPSTILPPVTSPTAASLSTQIKTSTYDTTLRSSTQAKLTSSTLLAKLEASTTESSTTDVVKSSKSSEPSSTITQTSSTSTSTVASTTTTRTTITSSVNTEASTRESSSAAPTSSDSTTTYNSRKSTEVSSPIVSDTPTFYTNSMPTTKPTTKPTTASPTTTTDAITTMIQPASSPIITDKPTFSTTTMPTTKPSSKPTTASPTTTTDVITTMIQPTSTLSASPVSTGSPSTSTALTQEPTTVHVTTTSPKTSASTLSSTPITEPSTSTSTVMPTTYLSHFENANVSGSPLRYVGIGYDLLSGNPGGMDASSNSIDPGLLLSRRILQLSHSISQTSQNVREVDYTLTQNACTNKNYVIHDGSSYQKELLQSVQVPKTDPRLVVEAFTFNKEFQHVRQDLENANGVLYQDAVTSCSTADVRYKEELANSSNFMVSKDFAADVCQLQEVYSEPVYANFISKWGTDIVMAAKVGTRSIERYRTTGNQFIQHLQSQVPKPFYPTGTYKGYPTSVTFNTSVLDNSNIAPLGSKVLSTNLGSRAAPVPISITLASLSSALDAKYWTLVLSQHAYMDVCRDDISAGFLHRIAANIEYASRTFRPPVSVPQPPVSLIDGPMTIPMTWPEGTYGLMEAAIGCPGSHVAWQLGYRKYDTEHTSPKNTYSSDITQYLAGSFAHHNLLTHFCMKTQGSINPTENHDWPSGTYCILKYHSCPTGFQSGFIYWDDNNVINHNEKGGTLPDGQYDKNTKIYYCCRNDASATTEIFLPRDRPFIFLRYQRQCQAVYGMCLREVFVGWDDEDVFNKDTVGGAHPYDDGGSRNHKLHFCHYSSKQTGFVPSIIG